jgi:restriction system protein
MEGQALIWEKRISHPGLKMFRVVRGRDPATVELMANLQLQRWEERWGKIELASSKRRKEEEAAKVSFQKKELALLRTREAERQQKALEQILLDGIEVDSVLDWEKLKDRSGFSEPQPTGKSPIVGMPEPRNDAVEFRPVLNLLDRLIPNSRSRRAAEAEQRFLNAKREWTAKDQQIRDANAKQQTEYETSLSNGSQREHRMLRRWPGNMRKWRLRKRLTNRRIQMAWSNIGRRYSSPPNTLKDFPNRSHWTTYPRRKPWS